MRLGKLSNHDLERLLLSKFRPQRPEVVLGPGVGLDCAVVDLGGELCVLSSDPITSASAHMGALAVHVCCNDAAAAGAQPIGVMTTLLLPPGTLDEELERIADDVAQAAWQAGIDVLGGHTEFTDAVTRPLISATILAKAPQGRLVDAGHMQVGDGLYMTKWAALEGSFILATDDEKKVRTLLTAQEYDQVLGWGEALSIVPEASAAWQAGAHAMHDATEGGVLGAAWEMAQASRCGLDMQSAAIALRPESIKIAAGFGMDPLRLMASGCLLIALPDQNAGALQKQLDDRGIALSRIGTAVPAAQGVRCDGQALCPPAADERYKAMG